jgi:uncharacterized protein (DUF433 family)
MVEAGSSNVTTRKANQGESDLRQENASYRDRIATDPQVMVGKPVVKGTRIPVALVLEELAHNPDVGELLAAHPGLTIDDIKACLAYAEAVLPDDRIRLAVLPDRG